MHCQLSESAFLLKKFGFQKVAVFCEVQQRNKRNAFSYITLYIAYIYIYTPIFYYLIILLLQLLQLLHL